jgi:hypothetical protein
MGFYFFPANSPEDELQDSENAEGHSVFFRLTGGNVKAIGNGEGWDSFLIYSR